MSKKFYLTTPIYYVNDVPHIGHAYTTVAADVLARYKRQQGFDVHFLTGTDEHGQKIWRAGGETEAGAHKLVDEKVAGFKAAWQALNIQYDDFLRTTEERHQKVVQAFFQKMLQTGDVYKGEYEGYYCTPCESFSLEKNCPDCGRKTELLKEETYFFRLSKYQDQLLKHIESNPGFIQPESRRNEILHFIKSGLKDLSVTRTAFPWGISLPNDPKHVVYVWFDALINYVSALGFPDGKEYKHYWPADVHVMGKEIVRFHAVIWPAMLLAVGAPLPKVVFGHGWWTVEGHKMSKTTGNVVDPVALSQEFGVDAVRYFLLREVSFGADGDFSRQLFVNRYNADLANDLGNLLSRTLTMVEKYCNNQVPKANDELISNNQVSKFHKDMDSLAFSDALGVVWEMISEANNLIEREAPWKLAKSGETDKLNSVLAQLCETLKVAAVLIEPFMSETASKIWGQLGLNGQLTLDAKLGGTKINKGSPLFPRLDRPS